MFQKSQTYLSSDFDNVFSSCSIPSWGSPPSHDRLSPDQQNYKKYPTIQMNGQRIYGPPSDWRYGAPPQGCEIFIGKLPRDLTEYDLIPLFEQCGKIYQFRLMLDFSGTNRGFAFVTYTAQDSVPLAIRMLDNFEIRPRHRICVVKSVDNRRLFIGKIPRHVTRSEVKTEIQNFTEGVIDVIMYADPIDKFRNRGFAFVEYESHRAATIARRKLLPGRCKFLGNDVAVDWAEPEKVPDHDVMAQVKVLYVRNLMSHITDIDLRDLFESVTGYGAVEHVKKINDYAFVHFATRQQAELARERLNGLIIDGAAMEIAIARPRPSTTSMKPNSPEMITRSVQFPQKADFDFDLIETFNFGHYAYQMPSSLCDKMFSLYF